MRTLGWKLGLLAALVAALPTTALAQDPSTAADALKAAPPPVAEPAPPGAAGAAAPTAGASAFDMTVVVADTSSKAIKMERTGPAKDFIQRAAIYLRYLPVEPKKRVHPAFINTHNYLTCPDKKDKKWPVEAVSRVDFDKGSAIAVYGFFFSRPECDNPTFHMEAIVADEAEAGNAEPAKDEKKS
jgi:hypothetical protein